MAILIKVRNNRTSREYPITEQGWDDIVKQGWEGRFTVLDRRQVVDQPKDSFIPPEIGAAATAAATALTAGQQEMNQGGPADAEADKAK